MESFRYIIVGGGMAAAAAVEGIRKHDREGSIAIFSQDRYPPYSRPPLSKGLWHQKRMETIWRYADPDALGITEHLAATVAALEPSAQRIRLEDGRSFGYGKLLIATGDTPRHLPGNPRRVLYLRSLDDYLALYRAARRDRFLVVGGGFIGAEIACALRDQGKEVRLVFPEDAILATLLPSDLARSVTGHYREKGVRVDPGTLVQGCAKGTAS